MQGVLIALYKLFALALFFGIFANLLPDYLGLPFLGEYFEIISYGFIGAIGWEIFRSKPWNKDDDGGHKIEKKSFVK